MSPFACPKSPTVCRTPFFSASGAIRIRSTTRLWRSRRRSRWWRWRWRRRSKCRRGLIQQNQRRGLVGPIGRTARRWRCHAQRCGANQLPHSPGDKYGRFQIFTTSGCVPLAASSQWRELRTGRRLDAIHQPDAEPERSASPLHPQRRSGRDSRLRITAPTEAPACSAGQLALARCSSGYRHGCYDGESHAVC